MQIHPLTFSQNDLDQLYEWEGTLLRQLEEGKGIRPAYFVRLQQALQSYLQSQTGLQAFWQNVTNHPDRSHRLHITHSDKAILNLPWQIAIDARQHVYLSKGLPDQPFTSFTPSGGPLRILVMIASPEDLDHNKRLSYEEEEQVILKGLGPLWESGQVQLDFTEDGSLSGLQRQLQRHPYHILYFSGHGVYKEHTGYLRMEQAETLTSEYVTAQQFGAIIKEHPPSLIILSSCQTARGDGKEGFRGIADELMQLGVPAVIAMAFSIIDQYAVLFAAHLYQQLAGRKSLPEAYTAALTTLREEEQRQLIAAGQPQDFPSQWLVPQLYCSRPVTDIVDWTVTRESRKTTQFVEGQTNLLLSRNADDHFIGRRRESALLFGQLLQNKPVLLRGQGGVGKTALAEHLAKRLLSQDPARYCFAFNETTIGIDGMITRLQQYLEEAGGLSEIERELKKKNQATRRLELLVEQAARFCRPVWIFDNLESCQQDIDGPLRPEYVDWMEVVHQKLLHRYPVIFTGRYPIQELPGLMEISLNQVPFGDFFRKCLQLNIRSGHEQLYTLLGGNYRILELFRSLKGAEPEEVILQQLQDQLSTHAKKVVFAALLAVLTEPEQRTFHFLFYFRWPVLAKALEMQVPGRDFSADLKRLKDLTLIEERTRTLREGGATEYTFYYITPLVREWARQTKLIPVEFYPDLAGGYFEYMCRELTHRYGDMEEAFFFYTYTRNIDRLNEAGAWILSEYYRVGLYDLVFHFGKIVESIAGVQTHEEILNNMGLAYMKYDKLDLASTYLTKFLITTRRKGQKEKETTALCSISQVYYQKKDLITALEWLEKSRKMAKENGFDESEAVALTNIGNLYSDRGDNSEAMDAYQQSRRIRQKTGNRRDEVLVLANIAQIYSLWGEHDQAIATLQEGLSIATAIADRQREGNMMTTIGLEYQRMEKHETAIPFLKKGVALGEEIQDQEGTGLALAYLGISYKILGNYNEAVECLVKGTSILQKFGYDLDATLSRYLGAISLSRGDYAEGIDLMLESLPGLREKGDEEEEHLAETLGNIGEAYLELGEYDKAITYLDESIALKQIRGDKKGESYDLVKISQAYAAKNDIDTALQFQEQNLVLQRLLGDRPGEALTLSNMAMIAATKGDREGFIYYTQQAYDINAELNNPEGLYFIGMQLGYFYCMTQEPDLVPKGLQLLEQSYEIGIQTNYPGVEELAEKIKEYSNAQP